MRLALSLLAFWLPSLLIAGQPQFLKARGTRVYLGDKEFREVGLHYYKAFRMYLDLGWDGVPIGRGKDIAREGLWNISEHGFRLIRVMPPFHPAEFNEVFFDKNPNLQAQKRARFFKALDGFLADCDKFNIVVEFVPMWHPEALADLGRHSLHEGIVNPDSEAFKKYEEFTKEVVKRYRSRPTIAMWTIGNEYNLFADLRTILPKGVLGSPAQGDPMRPGPLYRGPDNNFDTLELLGFFWRVSHLIKDIDPNHLLTTGVTEPQPSGMHRFKSDLENSKFKNEKDGLAEQAIMFGLLNQNADLAVTHYYTNESVGLAWYKRMADKLAKPLYLNETGPHFEDLGNGKYLHANYTDPLVIEDVRRKSREIAESGISMAIWWTYDCGDGDQAFKLCYGRTNEALRIIEESNSQIKKRQK